MVPCPGPHRTRQKRTAATCDSESWDGCICWSSMESFVCWDASGSKCAFCKPLQHSLSPCWILQWGTWDAVIAGMREQFPHRWYCVIPGKDEDFKNISNTLLRVFILFYSGSFPVIGASLNEWSVTHPSLSWQKAILVWNLELPLPIPTLFQLALWLTVLVGVVLNKWQFLYFSWLCSGDRVGLRESGSIIPVWYCFITL